MHGYKERRITPFGIGSAPQRMNLSGHQRGQIVVAHGKQKIAGDHLHQSIGTGRGASVDLDFD